MNKNFSWRWVFSAVSLVGLIYANAVQAHSPGLSYVTLKLSDKEIVARLTFLHSDIAMVVSIDSNADGSISQQELRVAQPKIATWARGLLTLTMDDQLLPLIAAPMVMLEQDDGIRIELTFKPQDGSKLQLKTRLVEKFATGHRQFLSVVEQSGQTHDRILSATQAVVQLDL